MKKTLPIILVIFAPVLCLAQSVKIIAWGENDYGECNVPWPNTGFVAIAAGYRHSLGLKQDGSIVAWGNNGYGQCNIPSPNTGFVAIAGHLWHSLGLKQDGSIVAWGRNDYGECNVPSPNSDFVAIAAGAGHSLGLKQDGSIVAWGTNDYGQCNIPSPNSDFIAIAAGADHSLGLKNDGSIIAWGFNGTGQCNIPSPNSNFVAVAASMWHNLGLKADGSIVAWGWNYYGECDVPSPNTGFVAVEAGDCHSLGLKNDGSIIAWGKNDYGQCNVPSPNTGFVAISAVGYHSLGLKADVPEKTLPEKAAELAKQVIGAEYKWGAKGWDKSLKLFLCESEIETRAYPYDYLNLKTGMTETKYGPGLDCAGLVFWAYNKAFDAKQYLTRQNPVYFEGANGQYCNDFDEPISEANLRPGDVLFFDFVLNSDYQTPKKDGLMDHVAMYVGPFNYPGGTIGGIYYPSGMYDCIHASVGKGGIVPDTKNDLKNWIISGVLGFKEFRRWSGSQVELQFKKTKGTDLIVTDPDGFTITKKLYYDMYEIYSIQGLLYYNECDIDGDGKPDDIVSVPHRKIGNYLIEVVPEPDNLPTDTYNLEAIIDGQTMVLAQDIPIQDIPSQPYEFKSKLNSSDFDNDGDVDITDLAALCLHWLEQDCGYPNWCEGIDFNYSGSVDFLDFAIFAQNWLWEKIPADLDINGDVDFADFNILANQWLNDCNNPSWCYGCDFDKSGAVDILDLAVFAEHWLEGI